MKYYVIDIMYITSSLRILHIIMTILNKPHTYYVLPLACLREDLLLIAINDVYVYSVTCHSIYM